MLHLNTHRLTLVCLLLALGAAALPAQSPPTIILDKGAREFPETFSKVEQLVELRDGRLLLLDTGESALMLVDMQRNTTTKVSRKGGGPLEYQSPGLLLGSVSDTLFYFDMMQARLLLLSPTATPIATTPLSRGDGMEMLMKAMPSATDSKGRMYGQTMGLAMADPATKTTTMPTFADTIEIQRLDRNSGKPTTLARIRNPVSQSKPKVEMSGSTVKVTMTAPSFFPSDAWAVLPDGRVAVLHNGVYQVHFVSEAGKVTPGPVVPYTPIPVTAAEKKSVVDSLRIAVDKGMAESRKAMASMGSAGGREVQMPKMEVVILDPAKWAATKPAYVAMTSSPDGRLWVTLSRAAGSRTTRYDVLSGTGALLAHVQIAAGERVAGFGRGAIYTVKLDEDDLQTLKRYTLRALK